MKTTLLFSVLTATLFFLQSCVTSHSASAAYTERSIPLGVYDYKQDYASGGDGTGGGLFDQITAENNGRFRDTEAEMIKKSDPKKIIYNAYMSLTVKHVDTVSKKIEELSKRYNGYATEVGTDRVIIRVESALLDSAIIAIGKMGRVDSKSVSGQDVTEDYYDLRIRMENAEKARTRYLELLAKAENVQAALLVEKELERLNNEIDFVKGRMNTINLLSTYSTITVSLKEKTKLGPLGFITVGIYKGIKWLFVRG